MLKLNMKLLTRNKGYLCFLVLLPLLSILFLNLPGSATQESGTGPAADAILEMAAGTRPLDAGEYRQINIAVYDESQSYLSDFVLRQLAASGTCRFYRYQTDFADWETAAKAATDFANRNPVGAVLYFPRDLEQGILNQAAGELIYLFEASADERLSMVSAQLNVVLDSLDLCRSLAADETAFRSLITEINAVSLNKSFIMTGTQDSALTEKQKQSRANIGYSLSFITLSFLFTGVFIGGIAVEERHNLVFTRILLTKATVAGYGLVKLILSLITTVIQIIIMGIGIFLFVKTDFGLPLLSYLFFLLGLGLLFNLLSVIAGVIADNILSANYLAFFIWTLTTMLSGLYFPLEYLDGWWNRIALLMPPYWMLKCAEMVMLGEPQAYSLFGFIIAGFLAMILTAGFLGIRLKEKRFQPPRFVRPRSGQMGTK